MVVFVSLLLALPATAGGGTYYRYTNELGNTVVDDNVPPEHVKSGYEVLNEKGVVIKVVPRELSPEEQQRLAEAPTENLEAYAAAKLKEKNLDLIVLNSMQDRGAGFGTDTNRVTMIDRMGNADKFELKPKQQVAVDLVQRVIKMVEDA